MSHRSIRVIFGFSYSPAPPLSLRTSQKRLSFFSALWYPVSSTFFFYSNLTAAREDPESYGDDGRVFSSRVYRSCCVPPRSQFLLPRSLQPHGHPISQVLASSSMYLLHSTFNSQLCLFSWKIPPGNIFPRKKKKKSGVNEDSLSHTIGGFRFFDHFPKDLIGILKNHRTN